MEYRKTDTDILIAKTIDNKQYSMALELVGTGNRTHSQLRLLTAVPALISCLLTKFLNRFRGYHGSIMNKFVNQ